MKDITGQATSAFDAETKLLVYNDHYDPDDYDEHYDPIDYVDLDDPDDP